MASPSIVSPGSCAGVSSADVGSPVHAKGLLGADYFLSGSMNLTKNGISVNGEHLVLRTEPAAVAEQSEQLELQWESLLK